MGDALEDGELHEPAAAATATGLPRPAQHAPQAQQQQHHHHRRRKRLRSAPHAAQQQPQRRTPPPLYYVDVEPDLDASLANIAALYPTSAQPTTQGAYPMPQYDALDIGSRFRLGPSVYAQVQQHQPRQRQRNVQRQWQQPAQQYAFCLSCC